MSEEQLVAALGRGELSALEELLDRYTPYVSSVAARILRGRQADVEELTADVFLAAWENREKLRPGQVKGWLGAVARNKAKNKLRQMGRTLPLEEDALDLPGPEDPAGALEREEEGRRVRRAVDSLPAPDRELFLRRYYYAQSVKEIAGAMGLNESAVKTRLRRGRLKLKDMLTKEALI